jgi:hypothetical protein
MEFLNTFSFKHQQVELYNDEGKAIFNERFYIQLNEQDRSAYLNWLRKENNIEEKEGFFSRIFSKIA